MKSLTPYLDAVYTPSALATLTLPALARRVREAWSALDASQQEADAGIGFGYGAMELAEERFEHARAEMCARTGRLAFGWRAFEAARAISA